MSLRNKRRWAVPLAALTAGTVALGVAGCSSGKTVLIRSDMPIQGMTTSVRYNITANPSDTSEVNQSIMTGMNDQSPMPVTTTFGKGAGSRTEVVQLTGQDGTAYNVLSMNKRTVGFGLTRSLVASIATFQMRDAKGGEACGAKVELDFQPNFIQLFTSGSQGWDAIWYYNVPCSPTDPTQSLNIAHASLTALVINQQNIVRITGKPIVFNRGASVTVVGGPAAALTPGWWEFNALPHSNASILGAADMVRSMVNDLNSSPQPWMEFKPTGQFATAQLVYSAGDADVYASFRRVFLDRQSDYIVNFRGSPTDPWHRIVVHPIYNMVWNDWSSLFAAANGFNPLNVDQKINKNGFPKNPNDKVLKEIETNGCQNCPNAELSQIQFRDGNSGKILYAITVRGYLGANSSLLMFGKVPQALNSLESRANAQRKQTGVSTCPVQYNNNGTVADNQLTPDQCAALLREGAMWDLITKNPQSFGFDLVSQFQVRDNSTWASVCTGSGKNTSCTLVAQNRKLDASYLFDSSNTTRAWTILQLLGEVGMRTLGFSYVSGPGTGNGEDFAMAQSVIRWQYWHGISDPSMVFALDARAAQLPWVLAAASKYLYSNN